MSESWNYFRNKLNQKITTCEQVDLMNQFAWDNRHSDIIKSFQLAEQALSLAIDNKYTLGYATSLKTLAQCYLNIANYSEAQKKVLIAIAVFHNHKDLKQEAECQNILGGIYDYLGDLDLRLECNLKCLELRKKANDSYGIISSLNNVGDTYLKKESYDKALQYFSECLKIGEQESIIKCVVYHNIGETYFKINNIKKSIKYLDISLNLTKRLKFYGIKNSIYIFKAKNALALKKIELAEKCANTSLVIAKKTKSSIDLCDSYLLLSQIYEKQEKPLKAFEMFKKYHNEKEKQLAENSKNEIKNTQFLYEVDAVKKETAIEKEKNIKLKIANEQIAVQKNEITVKNNALTASIEYAKRIQEALLPNVNLLNNFFSESFVLYKPKDIVSGDFYFTKEIFDENENKMLFVAVGDCTGHGVPGALLTMVCQNALYNAITELPEKKPNLILDKTNEKICNYFKTDDNLNKVKDGMDISLCLFDFSNNEFFYAGAYNNIFLYKSNKLIEFKADRQPIGFFDNRKPFTLQSIKIEKGDIVYLLSDGYHDQFGGEKGKKFKYRNFKILLEKIANEKLYRQKEILIEEHNNWRKDELQVDDICIVGVKK